MSGRRKACELSEADGTEESIHAEGCGGGTPSAENDAARLRCHLDDAKGTVPARVSESRTLPNVKSHSARSNATPIAAVLVGNECTSDSIRGRGAAPSLALCRALVGAGYDPGRPLHVYRGEVLSFIVRSIGEGSRYGVEDDRHGKPRLRCWRAKGCGGAAKIR
jgi:hypothetical protein